MQHKIVSSTGSHRLLLFFAGWGMDATPFEELRRPGYDVAVVWDYRSTAIDWSFTRPYVEICLVAWSFGVYAAAVSTHAIDIKVTRRIAVNGTLYPCDRRRGIPPAIFYGTLEGLDERNVAKFYRRMCGSADVYREFCEHKPEREVDGLRDELEAFSPEATLLCQPLSNYDMAIIGRDDAIIPPANQWRAWLGTPTVFIDAPHLADIQRIIDHFILDKQRVGQRFATGLKSYEHEAGVQSQVVEHMSSMMTQSGIDCRMATSGCRVLGIGSGTGSLTRILDNAITDGYLEMWDLAGDPCVSGLRRCFKQVDAETEIVNVPTGSFDVIASASTIQWFNSPARFLRQCRRALAPGGYVVLSSFLAGNLAEVSDATGRSLPLMTLPQWQMTIPRDFEIVDSAAWNVTLDFDSAIDVFRHLKATGVNALGRTSRGESNLHDILGRYRPALDGRFHITYKPFILILRLK